MPNTKTDLVYKIVFIPIVIFSFLVKSFIFYLFVNQGLCRIGHMPRINFYSAMFYTFFIIFTHIAMEDIWKNIAKQIAKTKSENKQP